MFITVKKKKKEVKDGLTVAELIEQEKVETHNVEFLYFMGGGQ